MGQDPLRQALLHVKLQENLSLVQAQTKLQRKHKRCISFMFTRKKILSWRNYRVVDPLKSVHFLVCLLEKKKKIVSWRNYRVVDPHKPVHFLVC